MAKLLGLLAIALAAFASCLMVEGYPDVSRVERQTPSPAPLSVEFPSGERLTPVTSFDSSFNDPFEQFQSTQPRTQVFDSSGIEDVQLSNDFQVHDFLPLGDLQLFRLSPRLVECLQRVVDKSGRALFVRDGYRQDPLATPADADMPEFTSDSRHVRGRAADIRFSDSSDQANLILLAEFVVDECFPLFRAYDSEMGLGLLRNSIHVNIRGGSLWDTWIEEGASMSASDWQSWVISRRNTVETDITQNGGCFLGLTFPCRSGNCIVSTNVCDREYDCGPDDNSDELGISSACARNNEPVTPPASSCFPENAIVRTEHTSKMMMDLQIGDRVLSVNSFGEVMYSPIIAFAAKMPAKTLDYVQLQTDIRSC